MTHRTILRDPPAGKQAPDERSSDPRGKSRPTIYLEDLPWTDLRTIQEQLTEEERKAVNKHLPPDQRVPRTSTVHNYTGRNDPPARFLVALKRAFPNDVDLNWLLFGDESGGAYALPEAFRKELPSEIADVLSGEAVLALRGVCARAAQSGGRTDEILSRLGFQVAGLLLLPHGALGFRGHPSGQDFTDYVFAFSHALQLAVRMRGSEGARLPFRPERVQKQIDRLLPDRGLGSDRSEEGDK